MADEPIGGAREIDSDEFIAPALRDLLLAGASLPHARVETTVLHRPEPDGYRYSHHPHIARYAGWYLAMWSSGIEREDRPGQRVLWARSRDGASWTEPETLMECPPAPWRLTAGGWASDRGRLFAFVNRSRREDQPSLKAGCKWYPPLYVDIIEAGDDLAWGPPRTVDADFLTNESPRRTAAGTWLLAGESARHEAGVLRSAPGPDADFQFLPFPRVAIPRPPEKPERWTPPLRPLGEPSWYQWPDGTIVCFLRDDHASGRLFVTESDDDGFTWSVPRATEIPDAKAKSAALALSDGRVVLVSNAVPDRRRGAMAVLVAHDGMRFDRAAILRDETTAPRLRAGLPGYQYPSVLEHDGRLWVIHSVNKEDIAVTSLALGDLP